MKKAMRFLAVALLLLPCALLLAACDSKVVGKWQVDLITQSSTFEGETRTETEKAGVKYSRGEDGVLVEDPEGEVLLEATDTEIEFKKDGTAIAYTNGEISDETSKYTWKKDGDKVIVTVVESDGETDTMEFTLKDGKLTFVESGTDEGVSYTMTMVFKKA